MSRRVIGRVLYSVLVLRWARCFAFATLCAYFALFAVPYLFYRKGRKERAKESRFNLAEQQRRLTGPLPHALLTVQ